MRSASCGYETLGRVYEAGTTLMVENEGVVTTMNPSEETTHNVRTA